MWSGVGSSSGGLGGDGTLGGNLEGERGARTEGLPTETWGLEMAFVAGFMHLERMEHLSLIPSIGHRNGFTWLRQVLGHELGRSRGIMDVLLGFSMGGFSFLDIIPSLASRAARQVLALSNNLRA